MATNSSNKRTANKQCKGLSSYLKYFEGMELTVELKNGRQVSGILSEAQAPSMNLVLVAQNDESQQTHIRGAAVRYIHFPKDSNLIETIRIGQDRERSAMQKYKRGVRK